MKWMKWNATNPLSGPPLFLHGRQPDLRAWWAQAPRLNSRTIHSRIVWSTEKTWNSVAVRIMYPMASSRRLPRNRYDKLEIEACKLADRVRHNPCNSQSTISRGRFTCVVVMHRKCVQPFRFHRRFRCGVAARIELNWFEALVWSRLVAPRRWCVSSRGRRLESWSKKIF